MRDWKEMSRRTEKKNRGEEQRRVSQLTCCEGKDSYKMWSQKRICNIVIMRNRYSGVLLSL